VQITMKAMNSAYAFFYIEGRDEKLLKHDIDTERLAKEVLDGKGSIYELAHKAAATAAEPLRVDRKKRLWIDNYEDDINAAGGDSEVAYEHYLSGRIDELCARLESEVVADLTVLVSGDEDEDDDAEEEDDDEPEDDED
jgi:hypothetical protein